MRLTALSFLAVVVAVVGCRRGPRPDAGMAAMRVKVVAEPKDGAPSAHDAAADQSYGPHARVDYAELDNIVVYVEPAAKPATPPTAPAPMSVSVDPTKSSHGIDRVVCVGQKLVLKNAGASAQAIYSVSD